MCLDIVLFFAHFKLMYLLLATYYTYLSLPKVHRTAMVRPFPWVAFVREGLI